MNTREFTCKLIEAADEGSLSWEIIARSALTYLSESEVAEMISLNELLPNDEDVDEMEEMKEYLKFLEDRNSITI